MNKKIVFSLLATSLISTQTFAENSAIVSHAVITKQETNRAAGTQTKEVYLMPVKLSAKQLQSLNTFKSQPQPTFRAMSHASNDVPASFQAGMNNVPVLDQGKHGSCVTFATTAAIDALLGKGDYVSQLCNLELGSYLEKEGYYPSGWDGSTGDILLNQVQEFGIVSKDKQTNGQCAGVRDYPLTNKDDLGRPVTVEQFKAISEPLATQTTAFLVDPLLTAYQRYQWTQVDADNTLQKVKEFISHQEQGVNTRLIFATLIPVRYCSTGACATFHKNNDTWALTEKMKQDKDIEFGGHEMVITGYDDNAVVTDSEGGKHQGLLTLRNSWGTDVGDNGDYYMTYDFFKAFVSDAHKLFYAPNLNP